jgi:hypothetical protein
MEGTGVGWHVGTGVGWQGLGWDPSGLAGDMTRECWHGKGPDSLARDGKGPECVGMARGWMGPEGLHGIGPELFVWGTGWGKTEKDGPVLVNWRPPVQVCWGENLRIFLQRCEPRTSFHLVVKRL